MCSHAESRIVSWDVGRDDTLSNRIGQSNPGRDMSIENESNWHEIPDGRCRTAGDGGK
jgi:hypothetical protein